MIPHRRNLKKVITKFLLFQSIILLFCGALLYVSQPISLENCKADTIVVTEKEYILIYREYKCRIRFNDAIYEFPNLGAGDKYTSKSLFETIEEGEQINISSIKRYSLRGTYNLIVDAKGEKGTYLSFEDFNYKANSAFIGVIAISILIELAYLCMFVIDLWLSYHCFKFHKKKR